VKRVFILLLLLILTIPLGLASLVVMSIGDSPAVVKRAAIANSRNADRVKMLVNKYRSGLKTQGEAVEIPVSGQDLESIIAFAARGVPSARADAQINAGGLEAQVTITLPVNPVGRYMNLGFGILPSDEGLLLKHVTIGKTVFSARFLVPALSWGADLVLGQGSGETITSIVSAVRFEDDVMIMTVTPGQDRTKKISNKLNELFDKVKDNEQLQIANPEIVQIYYSRLQEVAVEIRGGYVPLTKYIAPVFELAISRSAAGEAQTIIENQAAIMALAIYFGDARMKKLVGVSTGNYFAGSKLGSHNVTIKNRHDLVQHYLTSAGLQLATGAGIANAIGEFKEIADTLRGGTGFSFSDIAGDKAGVTLAEQASSSNTAKRVQKMMANVKSESDFFPDITGLPDNMTQSEFENRYGDVESQTYRDLVADIDRRIAQVPVYRGP